MYITGTDRDIYLKWTRTDGKPLPSSHRLQDGVLYINNVQPEDAGEYSCLGIVEGDIILFTASARLAIVGRYCLCFMLLKFNLFFLTLYL